MRAKRLRFFSWQYVRVCRAYLEDVVTITMDIDIFAYNNLIICPTEKNLPMDWLVGRPTVHLIREGGDPSKNKDCLPDKNKQFLVTRNGEHVPKAGKREGDHLKAFTRSSPAVPLVLSTFAPSWQACVGSGTLLVECGDLCEAI